MLFTFMDFISILEIALILFASGFALLLPLYAYLKNLNTSLKVCIPLSFATEILIGYIFYTLGQIKIFPLTYLLFILLVNIVLAFRLRLFEKIKKIRFRFNWKIAIPVVLILLPLIFSRFYDAILNVAPGAIDAAAHAQYVLDIDIFGRLSSTYYAPGFHILIYPLSQVIEISSIYRFTGPVLGIMTMLSLYLLSKDFFKNKISSLFLVLAFSLPVFNILTLQTISFFPTALTFIFVPMLVYLLIKPKELPISKSLIFYAITIGALALSVPYLLVQFIPAILLLSLVALAASKILHKDYLVFLSKVLVISLIGFILAFGHVYLQSLISKKNNTHSFPQIPITQVGDSGLTVSTNVKEASVFLENHQTLSQSAKKSTLVKNYIVPMIITGSDIISVKGIRPIGNLESIGAYLWMAISLVMIYLGLRKKDFVLLVFGSFILVFATATQTGILEMSTYRGRGGWYLLLFALVSSVYFLDTIIKKIPRTVSYVLLAILFIISFVRPPVFYRPYFPEYFSQAVAINRQFKNQRILLITDKWRITAVSKNFSQIELEPDSINDTCDFDQCFLLMEKKFFKIDPILSQSTLSINGSRQTFEDQQVSLEEDYQKNVSAVENSEAFSHYKIFWQDENVSVYRFAK